MRLWFEHRVPNLHDKQKVYTCHACINYKDVLALYNVAQEPTMGY